MREIIFIWFISPPKKITLLGPESDKRFETQKMTYMYPCKVHEKNMTKSIWVASYFIAFWRVNVYQMKYHTHRLTSCWFWQSVVRRGLPSCSLSSQCQYRLCSSRLVFTGCSSPQYWSVDGFGMVQVSYNLHVYHRQQKCLVVTGIELLYCAVLQWPYPDYQ
jgi:hypothetical protein